MPLGLLPALLVLTMAVIVNWQMPGCLVQQRPGPPRSSTSLLGRLTQHHQPRAVVPSTATSRPHARLWTRLVHAGGSSSEGADNEPQKQPTSSNAKQRAGPMRSLLAQLTMLARMAGTLVLLVAVSPYLLSSRLGTAIAAAGASRVLPGDVQIQRISLGWTQPLAVHGLSVFEGAAGSSRQLLGLQRLSSAEPLHEVAAGKAHLTLTLTDPSIDCSLTDAGDNFRLVKYIQQSRLLGILTGRHATPAAAAAGQPGGSSSMQHSTAHRHGHAAAKVDSHPIEVSDSAAADEEDAPATAARAAAASAAEAASTKDGQQQQPGAASGLPANFIQRLAQVDATSHVSAELRLPKLSVYIPDGQLLMPKELAAAMGGHIHAVAAAGRTAVEGLADELDEDCIWLQAQQQPHQPQQVAGQQQQPQPQPQQAAQEQQGASMADAIHQTWQLPPPSISRKAWAHATPLMLQVTGERVSALVRGWGVGSILRLSQSSLVLQQPATATWEFTPELAALTLSQFNPLLEEVALIRESGQLMTSIAPADGKLPAESGQLWVSPVKLVVGKGNLLSQIYRLLGLHGRFGSSGHHQQQQPWLSGSSSGSTTAAAAAKEAAAASADDGSSVKGLEVWSGPLRVSMLEPGKFRTDRVDMILGSGRNSMHLALWGTVDTNTNTLDMTVGLPASTLIKAGLRGLPPSYILPVAVSGPLHRPQVEWNAAVRQLAVLSAMQFGREAWRHEGERVERALWGAAVHEEAGAAPAGIAALFGAANRALGKATSSFIGQVDERLQTVLQNVPPPADLPWEHSAQQDGRQQQPQQQQQQKP